MEDNKNSQSLELAKQIIRDRLNREYGDWEETFDDLSHITLSYVLSSDEMTYTEIAVDLIGCHVNTYLGDEKIHIRQINFEFIEDLIEALLTLNFKELADLSEDEVDELDRRLVDAFERSVCTGDKFLSQLEPLKENWLE